MKVILKDLIRDIKSDLGRFLSLFAIVALGAGFYGGLMMTCPDMKLSADTYYDADNLMDLRVVSSLGLDETNIGQISKIDGVDEVMPSKTSDILAKFVDSNYAMRVQSIPDCAYDSYVDSDGFSVKLMQEENNSYVNRSILSRGEWPKNSDECVILEDVVLNHQANIGDTIEITSATGDVDATFNSRKLKITGFVKNPLYVCKTTLGTTSIGSGRIQQVCYVKDDLFNKDFPISEIFITVKGAKNYCFNDEQYQDCINHVKTELQMNSSKWARERTERIKDDAMSVIDNALDEYKNKADEAVSSLNEAEDKIREAQQKLASGQTTIEEAIGGLNSTKDDLEQKSQHISSEFESGINNLSQRIFDINNCSSNISTQHTNLKTLWDLISTGYTTENVNNLLLFSDDLDQYSNSLMSLKNILISNSELKEKSSELISLLDTTIKLTDEIAVNTNFLYENINKAPVEQKEIIYTEGVGAINPFINKLFSASDIVVSSTSNIVSTLNLSLINLRESYQKAIIQINSAIALINETLNSLTLSQNQLNLSSNELSNSYRDFINSKSSIENDLNDAYQKILDSKNELSNISNASFYVLDRTKVSSVESYLKDAERMAGIASIFPLFFFLVAALVALTTMTRKVEVDRVLIGTYKALGFSSAKISLRYILYAFIVSLLGSLFGILILSQILPKIVMAAYSIIYLIPVSCTPIDLPILAICTLLFVVLICLVTIIACFGTLKHCPATLMIPRAPKQGKKILLERISFFWKHLNFTWKVTLRNLFRYKKRLFMTVIGIAGCYALLLTGFGLYDSINDIIDINFSDIVHDDINIQYDSNMSSDNKKQLQELISDKTYINNFAAVYQSNVLVKPDNKDDLNVTFVAPSSQLFDQFRTFRSRDGNEEYKFDYIAYYGDSKYHKYSLDDNFWDGNTYNIKHGAVISEKLSKTLNAGVGDKIKVYEMDEIGNAKLNYTEIEIAAVCENYVGHYIYVMSYDYINSCKKSISNNMVLGAFASDNPSVKDDFSTKAQSINGVKAVSFTTEIVNTYKQMLSSVNYIVMVLVICAALLAIIVLYNLTNINISERIRELATLKVLGFSSKEINFYIHRETIILTIIGIFIGVFLGNCLESFVIQTAEVDQVMFGRSIHLISYIYSIALTLLFTLITIIITKKRIKDISMVESLKSVD